MRRNAFENRRKRRPAGERGRTRSEGRRRNPAAVSNRIGRVYRALLEAYGPQGWWPIGGRYFPERATRTGLKAGEENARLFEIVLGAVLTQNTAWKNAERALANLRERGLVDPSRILRTRTSALSELLRPSGYHNQKALKVKRAAAFAAHCFKRGRAPSREELLRVKGIGLETADSVLLYAYGEPVFVVDAYTRRLCARLGLAGESASYGELQALFTRALPADAGLYNEYHALIVRHGKERCAKDPHCGGCVLKKRKLCPFPRSPDARSP